MPLNHWFSPSKGTPDLFSGCSIMYSGVPSNWAGRSYTKDGDNYIGMYVGGSGYHEYREYIMTKLSQPLQAGITYAVSFFLRPATYTRFRIDSIQFGFTDNPVNVPHDSVISVPNLISSKIIGRDTNATDLWNMVISEYVAEGGETYFILGNMRPESQYEVTQRYDGVSKSDMISTSAYYFFDFIEVTSSGHVLEFPVEESFNLQTLYFEFNSYDLPAESKDEIIELSEFLLKHNDLNLAISGHTDEKGSPQYNQKLSEERVHSVKTMLIEWGISQKRITTNAYGETVPISTSDQQNRRVEFKLTLH